MDEPGEARGEVGAGLADGDREERQRRADRRELFDRFRVRRDFEALDADFEASLGGEGGEALAEGGFELLEETLLFGRLRRTFVRAESAAEPVAVLRQAEVVDEGVEPGLVAGARCGEGFFYQDLEALRVGGGVLRARLIRSDRRETRDERECHEKDKPGDNVLTRVEVQTSISGTSRSPRLKAVTKALTTWGSKSAPEPRRP